MANFTIFWLSPTSKLPSIFAIFTAYLTSRKPDSSHPKTISIVPNFPFQIWNFRVSRNGNSAKIYMNMCITIRYIEQEVSHQITTRIRRRYESQYGRGFCFLYIYMHIKYHHALFQSDLCTKRLHDFLISHRVFFGMDDGGNGRCLLREIDFYAHLVEFPFIIWVKNVSTFVTVDD